MFLFLETLAVGSNLLYPRPVILDVQRLVVNAISKLESALAVKISLDLMQCMIQQHKPYPQIIATRIVLTRLQGKGKFLCFFHSLHQIYKNTRFLRLAFSRISIEFTILSLYGKLRVS